MRQNGAKKLLKAVTNQSGIQCSLQVQLRRNIAQIAVRKHLEKPIIGEQLNLDEISAIAANELKAGEPNGPTNQSASEPDEAQSTDLSTIRKSDQHERLKRG